MHLFCDLQSQHSLLIGLFPFCCSASRFSLTLVWNLKWVCGCFFYFLFLAIFYTIYTALIIKLNNVDVFFFFCVFCFLCFRNILNFPKIIILNIGIICYIYVSVRTICSFRFFHCFFLFVLVDVFACLLLGWLFDCFPFSVSHHRVLQHTILKLLLWFGWIDAAPTVRPEFSCSHVCGVAII